MIQVNTLDAVLRWLHVLPAIVLVGGSAFMRSALIPAIRQATDKAPADSSSDAINTLSDAIRAKWAIFVHLGVALILITGFWNFANKISSSNPDRPGSGYHMLFGLKMILGLAVMFIAEALVGKSKALEPMRRSSKIWLNINLALAVATIMIGGVMKVGKFPGKDQMLKATQIDDRSQPRSNADKVD